MDAARQTTMQTSQEVDALKKQLQQRQQEVSREEYT